MKALAWDDKPEELDEIKEVLKEDFKIELVIEQNIRSFMKKFKTGTQWDFLIIDLVQFPEKKEDADVYAGYELALRCRETNSKIPIIILTSHQAAVSRKRLRISKPSFVFSKDNVASWIAEDINDVIQTIRMTGDISGDKVFIGHGHSRIWKDLKDFIHDTLGLKWDEFNREPQPGVPTIDRLKAMLNEACFSFHIFTAEDEHFDESKHARENVIHEAGLFQSKLGFEKAIILLEEGCEKFSNISGLGHIEFPKDNLEPAFEQVRAVLKREGILK